MSDTPEQTTPDPIDADRSRSGSYFVVTSLVFLTIFVVFLLVVSPRLQAQLGLNQAVPFDAPPETRSVPLLLDGEQVGEAIWDVNGVCAEIVDPTGAVFRTCAQPDSLRPVWAIDAPEDAEPGYVIVATPPVGEAVRGTTTDGEPLEATTQAQDLPAAWALIPLPPGAAVAELTVFDADNSDLGPVDCTGEDAPTDGSARLSGGCVVPRQD